MTPANLQHSRHFDAVLAAPHCRIGVATGRGESIEEISFLPPDTPLRAPDNVLAAKACVQIEAFLTDPTSPFSLPLAMRGSAFQRRVWQAIADIPCGAVTTYGEISANLGSVARAVGQACGANPFPLVVPCHRVISRSGIGGFAHASSGWLLDTKRWLLMHEGAL
ncbi:methylated-DNA--[protein]-cysteine S-methyltransferase [Uliginosibacterium sp. sgz301328]|uniref:methylated-DNA--[protein]-cysteine S-methyltransferase n=1 Tax=Uliginosibacterium sp. sgz301328 TaxID=3243764 RepID=UPI00359D21EE